MAQILRSGWISLTGSGSRGKLCSFGSCFESGCFPLALGSEIQCISGSVFRARFLRGNARAVNLLGPGSLKSIGTLPGLQPALSR